jgi:hypothetical protein
MATTRPATESQMKPELVEHLREHERKVAQLREEIGDVEEALSQFVREHFDPEAFSAEADDDDWLNGW